LIARCELCGSEECQMLFEGHDLLHGRPVHASVVKCDNCDLIYLWPPPPEPLETYPDDYAPHVGQGHSDDIAFSWGQRHGLMRKAKMVSQLGSGLLLDIGCGAGEFLAAIRRFDGRPVLGLDISERALMTARQKFGLNAWVCDVPGLSLPRESVSIITLWHVLEHLPHPLRALCDMARVLQQDGHLVVASPMVDSWEARLFGRYWSGYDVPRHLYAYSRETLLTMLQDSGFEAREVAHVVLGFSSARLSAALWLKKFSLLRRHPRVMRSAAALIGASATLAFELLSELLGNRRSVAVFVARRRKGTDSAATNSPSSMSGSRFAACRDSRPARPRSNPG
jgi:SAM-dependent methyltransferase